MPNLNKVQLMGNLTRDPELKYTTGGTAICGFGLAINRTWIAENNEKREETTFVDVDFWGKQAEAISKYVKKGHPLYIEGRLKLDQWDDKTTGQKRSKLRVVGEQFQFLKNKEKGEGGEYQEDEPPARQQHQRPPAQRPPAPRRPSSDDPLDAPEEDDIPF